MSQPPDQHRPDVATTVGARVRSTTLFTKGALVGTVMAVAAVLLLPDAGTPQPAGASARGGTPRAVAAMTPPDGSTWIVGTTTDQAATGQDDVNVEAWPADPAATAPAASALTYGGPNYNAVSAHGFFRLQVPSDQPYRIVFSAVNGQEDGDAFRMHTYGHGRPIVVRTPRRATTGRVRDLGTIQLVRQGKVASKTKATIRPGKLFKGQRGKLRIAVSSPYVTNVTGPILVRIGNHKLHRSLHATDHGKLRIKLPKLHRSGKHKVAVRFLGTGSVHRSKAKAVKVKVVGKA
jgi:hypothetical protein